MEAGKIPSTLVAVSNINHNPRSNREYPIQSSPKENECSSLRSDIWSAACSMQ